MTTTADFEHLVPDVMLDTVERVTGQRMSGMAAPLPSYINRVYAVQTMAGDPLIAKFYRPGRWSREALAEEHQFVADCADDEIPVVAPLAFDGQTLHEADGVYFALFPKRLGRLMGRVHVTGSRRPAIHRTDLNPAKSTEENIMHLLDGGFVVPRLEATFESVVDDILDRIIDLFDDTEFIRIHGDCHCGNVLHRPGEGLMLIDFDDMMMGPPVQDLWLLLPDHAARCQDELRLLVHGYEQFREFDDRTLRLIEPLRAMRIIYFLAWCSTQIGDYRFQTMYPDWGSEGFWQREIADLTRQLQIIETP